MKNIVLTGGTGFVGSHLREKLHGLGFSVFVITRHKQKHTKNGIHFLQADLQDVVSLKKLASQLPSTFICIDAAAHIPVPGATTSIEQYLQENFLSHVSFFELYKSRIQKVVYLSTVDVYGKMIGSALKESQPCRTLTSYGLSKFLLEQYYLFAQESFHIPVVILRLSQVYGSGAHPFNALPTFLSLATQKKSLILYGKGEEKRTYVHVDDVAQAVLLAVTKNKTGVYNVAGSQTCSLHDLIDRIKKSAPYPVEVQFQKRQKPLHHQHISIKKIQIELNFHPSVSLKQGIQNYLQLC